MAKETIIKAGCMIDNFPKYLCEFNFIEMFRGASHAWCRPYCTFNFRNLVKLVPQALDCISITKIRKFARKTYQYMDAYRVRDSNGNFLNSQKIDYALKKFAVITQFQSEFCSPYNYRNTLCTFQDCVNISQLL